MPKPFLPEWPRESNLSPMPMCPCQHRALSLQESSLEEAKRRSAVTAPDRPIKGPLRSNLLAISRRHIVWVGARAFLPAATSEYRRIPAFVSSHPGGLPTHSPTHQS